MNNNKPKIYRTTLNFSKAELSRLNIGLTGVSMPMDMRNFVPDKQSNLKDMLQLGLFGGSNNANTFYPGINTSDVMPKPEDFITFPFRLLSATTVGAGTWKATDFSNVGMLQNSMGKLMEKPVYYDHDNDLLNWVGLVQSVKWSPQFTNPDGIVVPAGIDGGLAIDAKTNPKIVRGLAAGIIFSNSVTVTFDWMPSHSFDNANDFGDKVGDMGPDGKMIRRMVTVIHDYYETSLVWLGADPFAKLVNTDGSLKNIDVSSIQYSKTLINFSKEDLAVQKQNYGTEKKYHIFCGFDSNILALSKANKENFKTDPMKPEILAMLLALTGKTVDTLTADDINKLKPTTPAEIALAAENAEIVRELGALALPIARLADATLTAVNLREFAKKHTFVSVDGLAVDKNKITQLSGDIATLTTERDTLKTQTTSLEADAKVGRDFLELKRGEAIRLYKLAVGDKATEDVITLFKTAGVGAIEGLLKQYAKDAAMKFSGRCKACGSDDFEFRSSLATEQEEKPTAKPKSLREIYESHTHNSMVVKKDETKK